MDGKVIGLHIVGSRVEEVRVAIEQAERLGVQPLG